MSFGQQKNKSSKIVIDMSKADSSSEEEYPPAPPAKRVEKNVVRKLFFDEQAGASSSGEDDSDEMNSEDRAFLDDEETPEVAAKIISGFKRARGRPLSPVKKVNVHVKGGSSNDHERAPVTPPPRKKLFGGLSKSSIASSTASAAAAAATQTRPGGPMMLTRAVPIGSRGSLRDTVEAHGGLREVMETYVPRNGGSTVGRPEQYTNRRRRFSQEEDEIFEEADGGFTTARSYAKRARQAQGSGYQQYQRAMNTTQETALLSDTLPLDIEQIDGTDDIPQDGESKKMRARHWAVTICNVSYEEMVNWFQANKSKFQYILYGHEISKESHMPHVQGHVTFANARFFGGVREMCTLNGKIPHISKVRLLPNSIAYCKKDNHFMEYGTRPVTPVEKGEMTRQLWSGIIRSSQAGRFDEVPPQILVGQYRNLMAIHERALDEMNMPMIDEYKSIWIVGETDAGKSHTARSMFGFDRKAVFDKNATNMWWGSYNAHPFVLVDDYQRGVMREDDLVSRLKSWTDKYPFKVERKGGEMLVRPVFFVFTSNYYLEELISNAGDLAAVKRRFDVYFFPKRNQDGTRQEGEARYDAKTWEQFPWKTVTHPAYEQWRNGVWPHLQRSSLTGEYSGGAAASLADEPQEE